MRWIATFVATMECWNCHTTLPDNARFCMNCGAQQQEIPVLEEPDYFKLPDDIDHQLNEDFFATLHLQLEEEQNPELFEAYRERLYESGFRDTLKRRIDQLIEQFKELEAHQSLSQEVIEGLRDRIFDELLDYFIIHFCKDLNVIPLPEAILKYQNLKSDQVVLFQLVMDYLDFDREDETVYTDFLKMPVEKIKNASRFFLFPEKDERILMICDQSAFGSCKEGFALTDKGIYWKAYLEKARKVSYQQLRLIEPEQDWITINGFFFNVKRSINVKMMKLLRKIKQL
ncbi:MAG: zinc ribbon domain-containing protein [Saprospiraceae bacterium]|nr:zinc ribbon domain-containing protein [Saprospiraceae bacterium]